MLSPLIVKYKASSYVTKFPNKSRVTTVIQAGLIEGPVVYRLQTVQESTKMKDLHDLLNIFSQHFQWSLLKALMPF